MNKVLVYIQLFQPLPTVSYVGAWECACKFTLIRYGYPIFQTSPEHDPPLLPLFLLYVAAPPPTQPPGSDGRNY